MKERTTTPEQKSELEVKADKFLDLLYNYDYVGKNAYFRNPEYDLLFEDEPLFNRKEDYRVIKGKKYIWMDAPYFRLGITKEGELFIPKKYWSFGQPYGLNIDSFLDPELWGRVIVREYTQARRGIAKYESALMEYHDLHFIR